MLELCFVISCAILLISVIWGCIQHKNYDRNKILLPHTILIGGAALSSFVWFLPLYIHARQQNPDAHALISGVLSAIKIFTADGIKAAISEDYSYLRPYYTVLGEVLSLWAPFLTFTFVLSFFKSAEAYFRYFVIPKKTHVFSELNEQSLSVARIIRESKDGDKCIIAFADIIDKNEEAHLDLVDGAKKINAILFRNDLEAIKWTLGFERLSRILNFYLISNDSGEKIRHAKNIVNKYNNSKTSLFLFDNGEESKILLRSYRENLETNPIHIKIARMDDIRLLAYNHLSNHGAKLFNKDPKDGKIQNINVTIIGFGSYGSEMFKALLWYCQMPGYKVNITIIDKDPAVQSRFAATFPDIQIGSDHQEIDNANDARYHIEFKTGTFGQKQFIDDIKELPNDTSFFVFMGNDEVNMLAIDAIRCAREQAGKTICPSTESITTVIVNQDIKALVRKGTNINIINDIDKLLSFDRFGVSSFIQDGMSEHMLGSGHDAKILIFGFGDNESRAFNLALEYCKKKNYTVKPIVYVNTTDGLAEKDRFCAKFPGLVAEFKPFNKDEFSGSVDKCNSLVICFEGNGVLGPSDFAKICSLPSLGTYNARKAERYFNEREAARTENYRNSYHLSDYNFYSSLSKALHRKLRDEIKHRYSDQYRDVLNKTKSSSDAKEYKKAVINGLNDPKKSQAMEDELRVVAEIEHVRWNAYMRTEGFVYNAEKKTPFKMHNLLVAVDKLSTEDRLKDI